MRALLPLLLLALPTAGGRAATLYVDSTIPTASCLDYDVATRSCGPGAETALQGFAPLSDPGATSPGDLVLIRGGVYGERLQPGASGGPAEPITYAAFAGELVEITGGLDPALSLADINWVVIRGLTVRTVTAWARVERCSDIIIEDCTFRDATAGGSRASVKFVDSHRNIVRRNVLDVGNDNLQFIHSDFNLAEDNVITAARHNLWSILCGNGNVIRRNHFANDIQKAGQVTDCEGSPSDAAFSLDDTHRNVIEENEFALTGSSGNASPYAGIQHAAQQTIIRRNIFHDTIGPALDLTLYADEALSNVGVRVYHDVFVRSDFAGVSIAREGAGTSFADNRFRNNILAGSEFVANDTRWDWYVDELAGQPVQLLAGRLTGYSFDHNNFFGGELAQPYVITHGHRTRADNPPGQSVSAWQAAEPSLFHDNLELPPGFVDETGNDYHLAGGSPMIDAGAFLTAATSNGSGVLLPVDDAGWFFEGLGFGGSVGDEIQLEGSTARAVVTRVDLVADTLTLDSPLTWSAGQGVTLSYEGDAPDLGAYEYTSAVPCDSPGGLPDADGDGVRDACDCAPDDAGSSGVPTAPQLELTSGETLSWTADALQPSAVFGIHRGELADLRLTRDLDLTCIEAGATGTEATDATLPSAAAPLYYLVQAGTCFGTSGFGFRSGGTARTNVGSTCP